MTSTTLQPIASTLIKRVFKWVILCVICFSSIQAWLNYNSIEKILTQQLMTLQIHIYLYCPLRFGT